MHINVATYITETRKEKVSTPYRLRVFVALPLATYLLRERSRCIRVLQRNNSDVLA